tara:strand:+ start:204 stop:521 length:318 start_codon:yes stop_codon:yes gene_type:complete
METKWLIILGIVAYLFLFELALSLKCIGLKEENLKGFFKTQHNLWMKFSHGLGEVMSRIILTLLWIVGFGPYSIVWKIIHLFKGKKKDTYWVEIDNENNELKYSF